VKKRTLANLSSWPEERCTIGDLRDKVHRKELDAKRCGQQFRFFRDEVIATMTPVSEADVEESDETEEAK
jgi:hypothetical protein